ncbi:hypothetical protein J8J40_26050, partial [Mycobacterium tuberculosis]|nr:hypothetical protein [Mycobacterium tuberculosis]
PVACDIAAIAPKVTSLVSMMVIANGDAFRAGDGVTGRTVAFGEAVLTVVPAGAATQADGAGGAVAELSLPLGIAHGLHARPAAQLANAAKAHAGSVT